MRHKAVAPGAGRRAAAAWRGLAACAAAACLVACAPSAPPGEAHRSVVLLVQEDGHEPPQPSTLADLDRYVHEFDAAERVVWTVRHVEPGNVAALDRAIDEVKPRAVVFLNDALAESLGSVPRPVPALLLSERSIETLGTELQALRRVHPVAAITWYSDSHERLLGQLASLRGGRLRSVVAFYHPVLDSVGIPSSFAAASKARGVRVREVRYESVAELERALESLRRGPPVDAIFIPICSETYLHRDAVARAAAATGLPAAYTRRDQVEAGGLLSVDAPDGEIWRQAARYTVMLLHGADPRSLDVAGPTRHESAVNLAAARELGIVVPYELLVEATAIYR